MRRPPSTIRLTWEDGRHGEAKGWRWKLTWGNDADPLHEEAGALTGATRLGPTANADDLYDLVFAQLAEKLHGGAYDSEVRQGHHSRTWTVRRGRRPRGGEAGTQRSVRGTEEQWAAQDAVRGKTPWATWAIAVLDAATREANKR